MLQYLLRLEMERRMLARNDREVFVSCVNGLKKEVTLTKESDPFSDLKRKQDELKKRKNKNN